MIFGLRRKMPKIALIDFDGTVVDHKFPNIGEPMPEAFDVLKAMKRAGWKLILWTCREDCKKRKYLQEAVDFCKMNGVEFDAVNETIDQHEFRDPEEYKYRRKPYARVCIDDSNLGGFPGWDVVRKEILDDPRKHL